MLFTYRGCNGASKLAARIAPIRESSRKAIRMAVSGKSVLSVSVKKDVVGKEATKRGNKVRLGRHSTVVSVDLRITSSHC